MRPYPRLGHGLLFAVAVGTIGLASAAEFTLGDGLRSPLQGVGALAICILCSVTNLRWGAALAALCSMQVGALAFAEYAGWTVPPTAGIPFNVALLINAGLIAIGLAGGALLTQLLQRFLSAAAERERQFSGLLNLAVDWTWELDEHFRFTEVSDRAGEDALASPDDRIGRTPWELSTLGMDEDELDAHRADLEAHVPFHDLLAQRRDAQGRIRYVSISGQPKFDAKGVFRGYRGVGRDITREVWAERATVSSETRYRELFRRSPTPLVLHRNGFVVDANESAARMFGFDSAAEMNGFDLRLAYADAASQARARERIGQLERMAVGEGLPIDDFQLISRTGRRLMVQATGVRVDTVDGPASLSLYFDITARVNAEAALRRSEALLSHLFATSPDLITVTEMATGRFAMVNPSFTRLLGYTSDEAVGRTSRELGTWHRQQDRDRMVRTIRETGSAHELPATFVAKSGALVTMLVSAARFEMDGKDYMVFNAHDVTENERRRLEHEAILQNASIGIAFSRERYFQHTNPTFERIFGWERGKLAGQATVVIWPSQADFDAMRADAAPVLARGEAYELEREMLRADGSLFWCRMRGQAIDPASPSSGGTIWTAEDVTQRRQVEQALAAARDAAEAANRAKSAFLANTSHEIRTPLNGLLGMARLAMQPGLDEQRRERYLLQIFDSAQSLAGIISDILDLSKIEAGKITLESVPFALRDTLVAVHDAYLSMAEAKGLELVLAIDDSVPAMVRGDPVRLRQILSNYITNALKFTERGRVRLHARAAGDGRMRFSVADTGPGIDAATQKRLFLPFSQADDSTTRRYGGTGLGLSICRELARLMGGEVGVDSTLDQGSVFWAELPLATADSTDAQLGDAGAGADQLRGARVLMVEDNPVNMMIAVAMLEQWGIEVTQAVDGRMALDAVDAALLEGRLFDAVLMDVQMPRMSGHEAAHALRQRFDAAQLPIIALTAAALVSEREQALASGMNEFLTKPIDAQRLKETLTRVIGASHGEAGLRPA
ncbi:MAG: PAS domain S-box protein [Betaproteobacteria bacterium]|nr:MAG: PAS domain S-box protein [Betaproteobacteria bacterium]